MGQDAVVRLGSPPRQYLDPAFWVRKCAIILHAYSQCTRMCQLRPASQHFTGH